MRRLLRSGVVLAVLWSVGGGGGGAGIARAQDEPKPDQLKRMYDDALAQLKQAQDRKNELAAENDKLNAKLTDLQKQLDAASAPLATSGRTPAPPSPALTATRDALANQQALYKAKLDQLQVDAALENGGAQVVAAATVPTSPSKPTTANPDPSCSAVAPAPARPHRGTRATPLPASGIAG